jgi:hypothetical protein
LAAAHRIARNRAMRSVGDDAVARLDERDKVADEIDRELFHLGLVGAGHAGPIVYRDPVREAVRHHDDKRLELVIGDQIVEDHIGLHAVGPDVLVAAPAMQKVKDRVAIRAAVVARWKVDDGLARLVDRLRLVLEPLHDAVRNIPHSLPLGNAGGVLGQEARRGREQSRRESPKSQRSEFHFTFPPVDSGGSPSSSLRFSSRDSSATSCGGGGAIVGPKSITNTPTISPPVPVLPIFLAANTSR